MSVIKYWTRRGCFKTTWPTLVPYAQLHRTDGPAVEYADGSCEWWVNGQLHRMDGPAIEDSDGHREWWVCGHKITKREHKTAVAKGELYVKMRYG